MKLTLEGLSAQLDERLLPIYLVSGDEPLLVGEASDAAGWEISLRRVATAAR